MAYNFPDTPTVGSTFNRYTWDGEKWVFTYSYVPLTFPTNTVLPVISGTLVTGSTLTTTTGTWTGTPVITFGYQWLRNGAAISGQTASSYFLVGADVGVTISVTVTGTNAVGSASVTAAGVGPIAALPANTVLPVISGTTSVGSILTTTTGTWTGSPTPTYSYQWKRSGADIAGATAITYTLAAADYGTTLTVAVMATNTVGNATVTSAATAVIAGAIPANTVAPVISGTAQVGEILSVTNNGTWTGTPTPTFTYQWKRGATNVGTGVNTYTLVSADVGALITCVVTGTNVAGNASGTSNSIGPIASSLSAPTIALVATSDNGFSFTDNITNDNTPAFDVVCVTAPSVGDIIDIAKDGVIVTSAVLTASDIAGTTTPGLGIAAVADGTYLFTARHTHSGSVGPYSAGVSVTIDTVKPVLTLPSGAQIGTTANATLSITTNAADGVIYWVVTDAAMAAPTAAQIIYGVGSNGLFPPPGRNGSFSVSSVGAKTATATGFSITGNYKVHFTHTDVAGNNAVVSSSAQWMQTLTVFTAYGVGGFDGTTTYLTNTITPATSIAAGKQGLISVWLKNLGGSSTRYVFTIATGGTIKFWLYINASNAIQVQGRNAGGTDMFNIQSVASGSPLIPPSGWVHCALAWDLAAGVTQIYVNGVSSKSGSITATNDFIAYNQTTASVGASVTGTLKMTASISELYVNLHETLDLSAPANLQKFIVGGNPVALGPTGLLPTGTQPEYYLGDDNTFSTWGTNNGSKGNFTTAGGALTSVTGPP